MKPASMTSTSGMARLLVLFLALSAPAVGAEEQCGLCHPETRVAFANSIHTQERISCTSCHGGNPDAREVEEAHRGDFRSVADRRRIPALCAACHSDLTTMRAYNLPVDQLAIYQTSQHGLAVARGDLRAAVCTDCHGAHDILRAEDPRCAVNPRNLPATCGGCHADEALTEPYGLDPSIVEEYRSSVHGQALLIQGNQAAPSCTSCHGVHGPAPPGVSDIDKVCGSCHLQTRRAFLEGPHYPAMADAGIPECASCHSSHAIRPFDLSGVAQLCADCHGEDSDQARLGRRIHTLVETATEEVDEAEALALRAARGPLDIEDHLSRIEEARTYLTESLPLIHSVSLAPVEQVTRRARSIGEEVQHELYSKLDRRTTHLGLVLFWFYVLMTLAILFAYKRRVRRSQEST